MKEEICRPPGLRPAPFWRKARRTRHFTFFAMPRRATARQSDGGSFWPLLVQPQASARDVNRIEEVFKNAKKVKIRANCSHRGETGAGAWRVASRWSGSAWSQSVAVSGSVARNYASVAQTSKSAVSQVSQPANRTSPAPAIWTVCRFGNRRYGRFGNLRYEASRFAIPSKNAKNRRNPSNFLKYNDLRGASSLVKPRQTSLFNCLAMKHLHTYPITPLIIIFPLTFLSFCASITKKEKT